MKENKIGIMNTYIIILTNGTKISIKAHDFEKNDTRIRFIDDEGYFVAIFMNNNIAGIYLKNYEA